jgi:hypothetical protein
MKKITTILFLTLSVNLFSQYKSTVLVSGGGTSGGSGSVDSISVTSTNGVTSLVSNPKTLPNILIGLGNITPTSIVASGVISGSNLSGTNSGDNATNTLYSGLVTNANHTGDVTGSNVLTIANTGVTSGTYNNVNVNTKGQVISGSNVNYLTSELDGSTTNEIQNLFITPTKGTINITSGNSVTLGDSSSTNEIELPSQSGQNGKYLTTNGTSPSWQTVTSGGASNWTVNGASINRASNVGINITAPASPLSVLSTGNALNENIAFFANNAQNRWVQIKNNGTTNGQNDFVLGVQGGLALTNTNTNSENTARIFLNGTAGTAGQVITSGGAGANATWGNASGGGGGSGTVTNVSGGGLISVSNQTTTPNISLNSGGAANGQVLKWNSTLSSWNPSNDDVGSGGGGLNSNQFTNGSWFSFGGGVYGTSPSAIVGSTPIAYGVGLNGFKLKQGSGISMTSNGSGELEISTTSSNIFAEISGSYITHTVVGYTSWNLSVLNGNGISASGNTITFPTAGKYLINVSTDIYIPSGTATLFDSFGVLVQDNTTSDVIIQSSMTFPIQTSSSNNIYNKSKIFTVPANGSIKLYSYRGTLQIGASPYLTIQKL